MKAILDELDQEHLHIDQQVTAFRETRELDTTKLLNFLNFVGAHHQKEEQKLFPWIAQQPWLTQGGPKCTFFMGMRLEFNPLAPAQQTFKEFTERYSDFKFESSKSFEWLQPSSPLSIPMEEHELGDQLKAAVVYLLAQDPQQFTEDQSLGKRLLNKYLDLLKMHLIKERDCLFVMCRQRIA